MRELIAGPITIPEDEIDEDFIRASGPGGQNVNKVSSAVQLRFDVMRSKALTELQQDRLAKLAGRRMTKDGVLVISASRFRTQEANREDARARLIALVVEAATPPKPRRATRIPSASKRKRREGKEARGQLKKLRAAPKD